MKEPRLVKYRYIDEENGASKDLEGVLHEIAILHTATEMGTSSIVCGVVESLLFRRFVVVPIEDIVLI